MPKDRHERAEPAASTPFSDAGRCDWYSSGKRCYLPGSMSPDIGDRRRKYCHWHHVALTHPSFSTDFEEFARWSTRWESYCSVENHYPISVVWQAIVGLSPLHGDPHSCVQFGCRHNMGRPAARKHSAQVAA